MHVNEIVKNAIKDKLTIIANLENELAAKNIELDQVNIDFVKNKLIDLNLNLNDTQIGYLRSIIQNWSWNNLNEIVLAAKKLIGNRTEILDEQDFETKNSNESFNPGNLLDI